MTASPRFLAAGTLGLALVLAACGGAASSPAPSPAPSAGPSQPGGSDPTPVPVPSPSDGSGGSGGATNPGQGGGGVPGNPGGGPVPIDPGSGGVVDPGNPTIVAPNPGAQGIHDVGAARQRATVNGRHVTIEIAWWSGVEPCNVLAGIAVARDGSTFTLTVREGSAAGPDVACIEIAMFKAAIVDLGELEPGTYTVAAFGDIAPIQVIVEA